MNLPTIYHIVDPVANGNRVWFMLWAMVTGEMVYVAREFPQRNRFIEGVGYPGPWAEPGTVKRYTRGGKAGPGQFTWQWGYDGYAAQIHQAEEELAKMLGLPPGMRLPVHVRIMDSRSGNTPDMQHEDSLTLIQIMDSPKLDIVPGFLSAGRDAIKGANRYTSVGDGMIAQRLKYDREKAILQESTGRLGFNGLRPTLFINPDCENLIDALESYPSHIAGAGDSAWDDPIDCLRYLMIDDPKHVEPRAYNPADAWGGYG